MKAALIELFAMWLALFNLLPRLLQSSQNPRREVSFLVPFYRWGKLRHKEIKLVPEGHTASR
jgi:hypothetical protein